MARVYACLYSFRPSMRMSRYAARVGRVQPQRRVRSTGPAYRRQEAYASATLGVRLQCALDDLLPADVRASLGCAYYRGGECHACDVYVTPAMTERDALAEAAQCDPPLWLAPTPTRVSPRRVVNRYLVYPDSIFHHAFDPTIHRLVVRIALNVHALVALWLPRTQTLELFDSAGFCADDNFDDAQRQLGAADGWVDALFDFLALHLRLPSPHRRIVVCRPLQIAEDDAYAAYCQTWTWFWTYHRLVRRIRRRALLRLLRPKREVRDGDAALCAIEQFKAQLSTACPAIAPLQHRSPTA